MWKALKEAQEFTYILLIRKTRWVDNAKYVCLSVLIKTSLSALKQSW